VFEGVVVVCNLCRSEEAGVYILPCFFVVYKLGAGECLIRCPHVVVNGPFVLV
jgi:hypothetical protein